MCETKIILMALMAKGIIDYSIVDLSKITHNMVAESTA